MDLALRRRIASGGAQSIRRGAVVGHGQISGAYMTAQGYANRSEAIRDLARSGLQQRAMQAPGRQQCLAALIYVYDHHQRELPKRLTSDFHDHHDLAQATLHVHLDHAGPEGTG
jgi:nickel-responsive transcriptional regulator NikR